MANNTVNFTINLDGNAYTGIAQIDKALGKVLVSAKSNVSFFEKFKNTAFTFNTISESLSQVRDVFNAAIAPGIQLNTSLQDLGAITGVTGDGLKEIEGYARNTAKAFGVDAAQAVESYKLVLSQLSPEIAKTPVALQAMGQSIATLSKTMGGDTTAADEVLTTAMNQFRVSTADPIAASAEMTRMMNVMAAAAKEGSAELPQIKQALEQAGMAAKSAGVSFEETNAAIQVLDKAGKKGSEGGIALRNVMNILSRGRFLLKEVLEELQAAGVDVNLLTDKSKTLTERLRPLNSVLGDSALFTKMFGMENTNAAMALVAGIDDVNAYTEAITGTNTAQEQAGVIMESYAEKQKRIQAQFDNLKISIFNATGDFGIWTDVVASSLVPIAQLAPLFTGIGGAISWCKGHWGGFMKSIRIGVLYVGLNLGILKYSIASAGGFFNYLKLTAQNACRGISMAIGSIPIVGWIAIAMTAIGSLIAYLYNKFDSVREFLDGFGGRIVALVGGPIISLFISLAKHWDSLKTAFTDGGFVAGIKRIGFVLIDALLKPVQGLMELLSKIPGLGKLASKGATWIDDMRKNLDKSTYVEKKQSKEESSDISILGEDTAKGQNTGTGINVGTDLTGGKIGASAGASAGKAQQINITLKSMVETMNFNGGMRENARDVEAQLREMMARILGMAETAV